MSAVPQLPPEPRSSAATSLDRRIQMLRTAMGPLIAAALEDPDVVEVMLNPDRTLWVDRLSSGRAPMGVELSEADGERIIRLVAAHVGAEVHRGQPLLSAELPETGERFEGILPPAAPGPAFALRKRAIGVIPLERYVLDGMMTSAQAGFLVRAVRERQNVLIAGATSSGKTTLANALLAEIAATGDRVLVLEDTVELQCAAPDHVPLRTRAGVVSMTELVRSSMRLRPDRVVVGEVRGAEALDLIKVWGTGHRLYIRVVFVQQLGKQQPLSRFELVAVFPAIHAKILAFNGTASSGDEQRPDTPATSTRRTVPRSPRSPTRQKSGHFAFSEQPHLSSLVDTSRRRSCPASCSRGCDSSGLEF